MNSRISRIASRIVGLFFATILMMPMPTSALSVNPAIHDVEIDPGRTQVLNITLENDEAVTQTYLIGIQKFIPQGEFGQQQFLDPSDTSGLPEWMFVERPEVTLEPGRSATLPVSIRVPGDAKSGGYYAALFLSQKQSSGEQVAMLPRIGILFFVRVNGPVIEKLSLNDFALDADGSYEYLPVGFRMRLTNEGNVHLVPEGTINVKNMFGSTVAKIRVNPDGAKILPDSNRVFLSAWSKGAVSSGSGYWHGLLQELSHFAVGPYTATLELSGRGFATPVDSVVTFSVWPWRTGVALLGLALGLVILFFVFKKLAIMSATAKSESPK
ncbi:MAG: hypothetical protein AAB668_04715 [Patescibacteria group bacterium]